MEQQKRTADDILSELAEAGVLGRELEPEPPAPEVQVASVALSEAQVGKIVEGLDQALEALGAMRSALRQVRDTLVSGSTIDLPAVETSVREPQPVPVPARRASLPGAPAPAPAVAAEGQDEAVPTAPAAASSTVSEDDRAQIRAMTGQGPEDAAKTRLAAFEVPEDPLAAPVLEEWALGPTRPRGRDESRPNGG